MRVQVSKELCVGCGECAEISPEIFKVEADAADIEREVRELREYCNGWVEKQIERLGT